MNKILERSAPFKTTDGRCFFDNTLAEEHQAVVDKRKPSSMKFSGDRFSVDEIIMHEDYNIPICPDCVFCTPATEEEIQDREVVDCKNIFVDENGEVFGQCCCYSKEHME